MDGSLMSLLMGSDTDTELQYIAAIVVKLKTNGK